MICKVIVFVLEQYWPHKAQTVDCKGRHRCRGRQTSVTRQLLGLKTSSSQWSKKKCEPGPENEYPFTDIHQVIRIKGNRIDLLIVFRNDEGIIVAGGYGPIEKYLKGHKMKFYFVHCRSLDTLHR